MPLNELVDLLTPQEGLFQMGGAPFRADGHTAEIPHDVAESFFVVTDEKVRREETGELGPKIGEKGEDGLVPAAGGFMSSEQG